MLDPLVVDAHVTMESNDPRPAFDRRPVPLWIAIRNRRIDFNTYARFIHQAFTRTDDPAQVSQPPPIAARLTSVMGTMRTSPPGRTDCLQHGWLGHGINAYELLKTATEIFLLLECGVFITSYLDPAPPSIPGAEDARVKGKPTLDALRAALADTLGGNRLPYINQIVSSVLGPRAALEDLPFADGILRARVECPCFLELMWSYWLEEGMLVQGLNALSMRFQNRRAASGRDPLAQLELSPLRPLSSIFWGYVQDEQHRLSLARRNFEYEHEYGLSLRGKAVPAARAADRRSKFIEGFHDLLYRSAVYYQQSANLQFNPDPFPLLNGLKEVHLVLSQGAGNQFGDLPWTARVEMLMQQWILARPEIREFLGRRPMVAYEEDWMANADALKTAMGWTDTSIVHFRNLAVYGEQLLLSIRWHAWSSESDASTARDWANYWRPEIQGYLHAYRIATGVDLSTEPRDGAASKHVQAPSLLLEARMGEQRRNGGAP
ncbi:MAG: hypothetical protein H7138_23570 [Myxococcales bacterium]|nr:hypothetical protein [Myxococcales bacterium]